MGFVVKILKIEKLFIFLSNLTINSLKMQEIPRENLVPGKEYYLKNFEEAHSPPNKPYKMIGLFEKLEPSCGFIEFNWACFSDFRNIEHRNDPTFTRYVCLVSHWEIYEMPRQKNTKNHGESIL
jgi:hypothetical protein